MFSDHSKIYTLMVLSFILLFGSLIYSLQNINNNTHIIETIEKQYFKLSFKISELNYKLKKKQSNTLQAVVLEKPSYVDSQIFVDLVDEIDSLAKKDKELNKLFEDRIVIIRKRLIAYKSIETSIDEALKNSHQEDLEDAIIGYNSVTKSFFDDIKELQGKMNDMLNTKVSELKISNESSQHTILVSFLLSVMAIIFSILKLNRLQINLKSELNRAIKAEDEQKNLQKQLLKYNENLESEITKKTNELYQKVYTHFLSGLPNRNKLLEDSTIYNFSQIALLNIDQFQKFNDVYGEEMGNIALQKTAIFIKEFFPTGEAIVYHISGDEFAIVIKESSNVDYERFIQDVHDFLRMYKKEIFDIEDKKYSFMMSAGIAFGTGKKILAYVDMALKDAKNRNVSVSIFNEEEGLEKIHKEDIETKNKLIKAFENNDVISHFQPISPIQNDMLDIKYESLVRIKDGDRFIPPLSFIDVAKQNKMYYKITRAVLNNTLEVISKYQVPCSINLSIVDIENDRTLEYLYDVLDNFDYNHLITIELLETEEFKDYDKVYNFCTKIRSYGIKIALDDFGVGYSNFSHILNLPIDYIKIDASLISNIDRDTHSQIMVETIVGLAHKLNVLTIAEFVSSREILDTVKKLKVDYAQGYYVGKPENITHYIPYL